jgi:hypothetical protein
LDKKVVALAIMDCLGRVVSEYEILQLKNSTIDIDVSHLKPGPYFIKVSAEGNQSTTKMIKQ